jgi:hypothetical protein
MGKIGFVTAVIATLILDPIPILGMLGGSMRFLGNGSWPSAVYALWDSIFFAVAWQSAKYPVCRGFSKLSVY